MNKPNEKKVNVVCVVKSGGIYNETHLIELNKQINRYNQNIDLYCLTDLDIRSIDCQIIKLKHNLKGWFSKLEIFEQQIGPFIYLDLDVIITGKLDTEIPKGLWILKGFKGIGINSSVMLVNGNYQSILKKFLSEKDKYTEEYTTPKKWGDQDFIRDCNVITGHIQEIKPNFAGSWRQTLRYQMGHIKNAPNILVFHGKPKPEDIYIKHISENTIFLWSWTYLAFGIYTFFKKTRTLE